MYKALFLDRDGVVNIEINYAYKPEQIEFVEGIFEFCSVAHSKNYLIFIVTNQAGIARGFYTERDFIRLSKWMKAIFQKENCPISKIFYSPFHPEAKIGKYKKDSSFRKPNSGMIEKAIRRYNLIPEKSILVGDKESDIQAGILSGIKLNLLFSPTIPSKDSAGIHIQRLKDAIPFLD